MNQSNSQKNFLKSLLACLVLAMILDFPSSVSSQYRSGGAYYSQPSSTSPTSVSTTVTHVAPMPTPVRYVAQMPTPMNPGSSAFNPISSGFHNPTPVSPENPFHFQRPAVLKFPNEREITFQSNNYVLSAPKIVIPPLQNLSELETSILNIFKKENDQYVERYKRIRPENVKEIVSDMFATLYVKVYELQKTGNGCKYL